MPHNEKLMGDGVPPMRVTYLHQHFVTPEMTGGTRSYEFARRLVQYGHDVTVVAGLQKAHANNVDSVNEVEGIKVEWIKVDYDNSMNFFQRLISFIRFALSSAKVSASIPSDVIFASSTPLTIVLPGVWAKWRQKVPMVFEVRDIWPLAVVKMGVLKNPFLIWLAEKLESFAYRKSARIVSLSRRATKHVVDWGYKEDFITTIPNASDIAMFDYENTAAGWFAERIPELASRKIFLYAGTVGRVNGLSYLVDIAKEARKLDDNVAFVVVGSGNTVETVKNHAANMGVLDENFFMIPAVKKSEMPRVLAGCDMASSFVVDNPHMSGDSANKFFDALAAAKPVCINHGEILAELLIEKGAGIVLPPSDAKVSAKKIIETLRNDEVLRTMSAASIGLAKSNFDRNVLAKQLEQTLYAAIVDGIKNKRFQ